MPHTAGSVPAPVTRLALYALSYLVDLSRDVITVPAVYFM